MLRVCKQTANRNSVVFTVTLVGLWVLGGRAHADGPVVDPRGPVEWQPPSSFPEFPVLPTQGPFLRQADMMSISTQEDIFVRRELLEHNYGEYLEGARNQVNRNAQIDMVDRLAVGNVISDVDHRKAHWEKDMAQLDGETSGKQAEILMTYEEMGTLRLRVMAGEDVRRELLLALQVKVRELTVEAAEKRLERARVDHRYKKFRWDATRSLADRNFSSREEYLDEMIALVAAEQAVATEARRLELAKMALEIVRRQAGGNSK